MRAHNIRLFFVFLTNNSTFTVLLLFQTQIVLHDNSYARDRKSQESHALISPYSPLFPRRRILNYG